MVNTEPCDIDISDLGLDHSYLIVNVEAFLPGKMTLNLFLDLGKWVRIVEHVIGRLHVHIKLVGYRNKSPDFKDNAKVL